MTSVTTVQVEEGFQSVGPESFRICRADTYVDESGLVEFIFVPGMVSANSAVFASVCQTEDGEPFVSETSLTVHEVTPMADSLTVRIGIEPNWGRYIRLTLLIVN